MSAINELISNEDQPSDDVTTVPADGLRPCGSASISRSTSSPGTILTGARLAEDAGLDGIWAIQNPL